MLESNVDSAATGLPARGRAWPLRPSKGATRFPPHLSVAPERRPHIRDRSVAPVAAAGPVHHPLVAERSRCGANDAPRVAPAATDLTWRRIDLHLHTPASTDYQEPQVSILDILRRAEERELDAIAFTDHNSVRGYADLWREIEDLELLEYLGRLRAGRGGAAGASIRRLLDKILLLPGFEFTATFGFHILAIFPERTSVRMMEHLLLLLGVPEDRFGSGEVGATTDVLRAYEILADHGALVIGAHVNSTNGIAMQGLRFGGQTKIAYTQDPHLHALEVTDLALGGQPPLDRPLLQRHQDASTRAGCTASRGRTPTAWSATPSARATSASATARPRSCCPSVSFAALKALFAVDDFAPDPALHRPHDPFEIVRAPAPRATPPPRRSTRA